MKWFPVKVETKPSAPTLIQVELDCMKCGETFAHTFELRVVQTAPGFCFCCRQVIEWMKEPKGYLDFLEAETLTTLDNWIREWKFR